LQDLGYGPEQVAAKRPGIVYVSLSAYGTRGPWQDRRGFDSLVQAATGFNLAEAQAAGDAAKPRALPMQILDQATGYLIAFGAAAALARQQREGGSWHVQVSLAQTGHWLRHLGRVPNGLAAKPPELEPWLETVPSGFGDLRAVRHSAQLSRTPAVWTLPAVPPGHSPARW
jgi:crotonobetainyl-CoA:carnitine CoA-transferase CaiB-like acyl-CoA transferase